MLSFTNPGVGVCQGLAIYLFEQKEPNKLRDFMMILEHPSEDVCAQWVLRIQNALSGGYSTSGDVFYMSPMTTY